ncbi:unnamed protein product [Paramecium sonneborni]|uniref:Uncharacterized protein n=1 Tax=Paramecium sonneborni TaxID=65129 RepID=A0A8S1LC10_9CILI|nr:unnamed protein product [Paramecium sonneborni]
MLHSYLHQNLAQLFLINYPQYYQYNLNGFLNTKITQQQQKREVEGVQTQVKVEDEGEGEEQQKKIFKNNNQENNDNKIQIFPGSSKNYYKNIGQKIVKFIVENFSQDFKVMNDSQIKQFIKISSQGFNRSSLQRLKKSKIARKILKLFFLNFQWVKPFITQHKAELDLYFRYNNQSYCSITKKTHSGGVNINQIKQEE